MSAVSTFVVDVVTDPAQLDAAAWDGLVHDLRHPYMDRRFLTAVVTSLGESVKYWFAIVRDATGKPCAAAAFSLYPADGGMFLPESSQHWLAEARKNVGKRFFEVPVLLTGTPVTTGESGFAFADGCDRAAALREIDRLACRIGRETGAFVISVKEFDPVTSREVEALAKLGYRYAETALTWTLTNTFRSFDDYYNSRTKRTRANMRKYMKRFDDAGLTARTLRGATDRVAELYTDAVHQLYLAVFRKAAIKFEKLPAAFFREIALRLGDDSHWTFVYSGAKIVGFVLGIHHPRMHYMLLCGVDYEVNDRADLYFNLIFHALKAAIADGPPEIRVGASADEFKMRLGSECKTLGLFMKSPHWWVHPTFQLLFPLLFPGLPAGQKKYLDPPQEGAAETAPSA